MDLLAPAKMKATTIVTLFITFLIAVGCSSAEVNDNELILILGMNYNVIYDKFVQHFNEAKNIRDIRELKLKLRKATGGPIFLNDVRNATGGPIYAKPGHDILIIGQLAGVCKHVAKQRERERVDDDDVQISTTDAKSNASPMVLIFRKDDEYEYDDDELLINGLNGQHVLIQGKLDLVQSNIIVDVKKVLLQVKKRKRWEKWEKWKRKRKRKREIVPTKVATKVATNEATTNVKKPEELKNEALQKLQTAGSSWIAAEIFSLTVLLAAALALISWNLQKKTKTCFQKTSFSKE